MDKESENEEGEESEDETDKIAEETPKGSSEQQAANPQKGNKRGKGKKHRNRKRKGKKNWCVLCAWHFRKCIDLVIMHGEVFAAFPWCVPVNMKSYFSLHHSLLVIPLCITLNIVKIMVWCVHRSSVVCASLLQVSSLHLWWIKL